MTQTTEDYLALQKRIGELEAERNQWRDVALECRAQLRNICAGLQALDRDMEAAKEKLTA